MKPTLKQMQALALQMAGKTYRQVAEEMDISVSRVKQLLGKARKKLRSGQA